MMSMRTPMLEAPVDVPVAAVVVDAPKAVTTEFLDAEAASLRRAATALLVFSMMCSMPWPSIGWLGVFSAFAVLCATPHKLLYRARVARFLAVIVAVTAAVTVVRTAMKLHDGTMPQALSEKFGTECRAVPTETFQWGQHIVATQVAAKASHCKGMAFMTRHLLINNGTSIDDASNASHPAHWPNPALAIERWTQAETCDKAAYIVKRASKAFLVGYTIAHLLLLLSALGVVKGACRLRCAAYRVGLLQCQLKKCAAKRFFNKWKKGRAAQPEAAEGPSPATKELA